MKSGGSSPWKSASTEQTRGSADANSFPPLNAKGPSKAQSRKRALYTQTSTFEPYPPRLEQLNRQELNRLQSASAQFESESDAWESEAGLSQPAHRQSNGLSSVTIYDAEGHRVSTGPDIYRRNMTSKSKQANGKERERDAVSNTQLYKGGRNRTSGNKMPLPTPFTDKKLDTLIQESQRWQRLRAIESRGDNVIESKRSESEPLTDELLKTFASLDGFLAAFGQEEIVNSNH